MKAYNAATQQPETIANLPKLSGTPVKFVYLRLPPCSSCTDTGHKAIEALDKELLSYVVVGLDEQPTEIQTRLTKLRNKSIIPWKDLPANWKIVLPGIYDCSTATASCIRRG